MIAAVPGSRDASLIRLVSMLAIEANDEWLVGHAYISQKSMATLSDRGPEKDISLNNKTRRSSSSRPSQRSLHRRAERRTPTPLRGGT